MGVSWGAFGTSWGLLGTSWAVFGTLFEPFWVHLGAFWAPRSVGAPVPDNEFLRQGMRSTSSMDSSTHSPPSDLGFWGILCSDLGDH